MYTSFIISFERSFSVQEADAQPEAIPAEPVEASTQTENVPAQPHPQEIDTGMLANPQGMVYFTVLVLT